MASVKWDEFYNIIDGKPRSAKTLHYGIDPCTGERLWPVPVGAQDDLDDAVDAAHKAFLAWRKTPLQSRKQRLSSFKQSLLRHSDKLTELVQREAGKPTKTVEIELHGTTAMFDYHIGLTIPNEDRTAEDNDKVITTRYTPLGVVGAICPWNFPIILALGKVIPALLTGNTVVVKPSPFTPYSTLKVVEIAQEFFPPGVLSIIGGDDKLGPLLTAHPKIAMISFTGSIGTGKRIMAACAHGLKRFTLELGGNDAAVVCPDVDVKKTAPQLVIGAFLNSGQICVATKRIYVHQDIYDDMLEEMVRFAKALEVGSPTQGAFFGPVQNRMQFDKVQDLFKDTKENQYKFAIGGGQHVQNNQAGFFIKPAIIDDPPDDSRIVQEEPFGPIVPVLRWVDEEDVIQRANATNTGLGACVWSKDVERAKSIAMRLEAGSVWINSFEKPDPQGFFSGHKESGLSGAWGPDGYKVYCNTQVIHTYKS